MISMKEVEHIEKVLVENVARIAHEVNKAYCESIGDFSQPSWKDAPEWQKKSAIDGVIFHQKNPNVPPEMSHENWLKVKKEDGWIWGPVKDPEAKEHPCMVPYENLPQEQKTKDYLFKGVVKTLLET